MLVNMWNHVTLSISRICWHAFWITLVLLQVKSEIPAAVLYKMKDIHSILDLIQFIELEKEEYRYLIPHHPVIQHTDTGLSPKLPQSSPDKRGQHFIGRDSKSSEEDSSSSSHPGQSAAMLFMSPQELDDQPPVNRVDASIAVLRFMAEEGGLSEMAGCEPREKVIEIPFEKGEVNTMYYPPCVSLRRCGGCCLNSIFQCEAQTKQIVNKRVVKMVYDPSLHGMSIHSIVTKELIEDTSCSCECKIKPEHCNPETQVHRNCQCECVVTQQCPPNMRWDHVRCQCVCDTPLIKRKCSKKRHTYSDHECRCVCRPQLRQSCTYPNVFNEKKCRCLAPRIRKSIKDLLIST